MKFLYGLKKQFYFKNLILTSSEFLDDEIKKNIEILTDNSKFLIINQNLNKFIL